MSTGCSKLNNRKSYIPVSAAHPIYRLAPAQILPTTFSQGRMVEPIYRGKEQTQKKTNFKEPIKVPIFLEVVAQQTILLHLMTIEQRRYDRFMFAERNLLVIYPISHKSSFLKGSDRYFWVINISEFSSLRNPFVMFTSLPEHHFKRRRFTLVVQRKS